jgi:hypothetical protein
MKCPWLVSERLRVELRHSEAFSRTCHPAAGWHLSSLFIFRPTEKVSFLRFYVAGHPRSYGEGEFVSNPLHYLALIQMKPNALDQAAALQG